MSNTYKIPFVKTLFRYFIGGVTACTLLCVAVLFSTRDASAKVCFLPGGKCPGEAMMNNVKAIQGEQCLGYTLTQIKCKDQACEEGWKCTSCTNAQGTYYKCEEVPTPDGYEPGITKCTTPCQAYTHSGFTGNQINGNCTSIPGYSTDAPAVCTTFQVPDYIYGIKVSGNSKEDLHSKDKPNPYKCYFNVVPLEGSTDGKGFTRTNPGSCKYYLKKMDSYDKACYANIVHIDEEGYFSTNKASHFPNIFNIEEKAGTDGVTCYRIKRDDPCNGAYGWSTNKPDTNIFIPEEKTLEGKTCYRAKACNTDNVYSEEMPDAKYFESDKHTESKNTKYAGITCYRAKACINGGGLDNKTHHAYASQPDTRFFKSTSKTSNGHTCWIATGKADYAYAPNDRKTAFFDYTTDNGKGTADVTATDGTITNTTYYVVNKDNGRNGCAAKAYEATRDDTYFGWTSLAHYSNGSSTQKTCYNATGCRKDYAYLDKYNSTHFAYDDGKKAYFNGNGNETACYKLTGCSVNAYPDKTSYYTEHFAYDDGIESHKNGGAIKCYNVTGCRDKYAYLNKDLTTHFKYDDGQKAHFNGNTAETTCYKLTGCSVNAYDKNTENTNHFAYDIGKGSYKEGGEIKCYNVTGCRPNYAYLNKDNATYFKYDDGLKAHFNGNAAETTCYKLTDCAAKAYPVNDANIKTAFFKYSNKSSYKDGAAIKCYNATGCSDYAYDKNTEDTGYFTYTSHENYINGGNKKTCYNVNGCNTSDGAENDKPSETIFVVSSRAAFKNGKASSTGTKNLTCYRADSCNATNHYSTTKPLVDHFTESHDTKSGITCYVATGCVSKGDNTASKPGSCKTYSTKSNGTVYCYHGISTTGASDCTTTKPGSCKNYSSGTDTNGNTVYYSISTTGASDCTTDKPTCNTWTSGTDTNGNTVYYSISAKFGSDCTTKKPGSCKTYSTKKNTDETTYYYGISTTGASDCTTTKPTCNTWTEGKDTNGNTVYYSISEAFGSDCTTKKPTCNTWSSKKNTAGTLYYYSISAKFGNDCTTSKPTCNTWSSKANTAGTTYYYGISAKFGNDCTTTKPTGCKTWSSKENTAGTTYYYGISAEFSEDCTTDKPGECKTYNTKDNTDGTTYYYSISTTGASDCTTTAPGNCKIYSSGKDTNGNTVYYSISSIGTDATTTKPSVTNASCHSYSTKKGTNGTLCYYNIQSPNKPATSKNCGTCGYQTRTPTCNSDGTGWSEGTWSTECTEVTKTLSQSCTETGTCTDSSGCTSTVQNCGTCGYQTRTGSRSGTKTRSGTQERTTKECKGSGSGRYWTYNDWGACSGSGNWGACSYGACSYGDWGDCNEASKTLSQSCTQTGSCSDSTGCTDTVQNCGTCGYQTRTGSRSGTKTRSGTQERTTKECKGSGTGRYWTYNDWGACSGSGDWGACSYGDCSYGDYGDCVEATKTLSQSCTEKTSCTDSSGCTDTSTTKGCSCGDSKTRTGSRTGSKSRSGTQKRTAKKCEGSGTGRYWTYNDWGACSGSGEWGACGNYGSCTYGKYGNCSGGDWDQCTTTVTTERDNNNYTTESTTTTSGCSCNASKSGSRKCYKTREVTTKKGSCCADAGVSITGRSDTYNDCDDWSYGDCGNPDCGADKKCSSGSCVAKGCTDYNSSYVTSCTSSCNSTTGVYTYCEEKHPRTGLTCYLKKTKQRPSSCAIPTCSDYNADNVTALGSNYGYQVSGFTGNCTSACGIAAVMTPTNCPGRGNIYLIRCCPAK